MDNDKKSEAAPAPRRLNRSTGAIRRSIRAALQFGKDYPLPKPIRIVLPEQK